MITLDRQRALVVDRTLAFIDQLGLGDRVEARPRQQGTGSLSLVATNQGNG